MPSLPSFEIEIEIEMNLLGPLHMYTIQNIYQLIQSDLSHITFLLLRLRLSLCYLSAFPSIHLVLS